MAESILEQLKRQLEVESESQEIGKLPPDFYTKVSSYAQRLRRSASSGGSEAALRLISVQVRLIESMSRQLLQTRASKALRHGARTNLLPEERYLCLPREEFDRRFASFLSSLSEGKPSFIEFARKSEIERMVVVRFTKDVGELVGFDLKRYGPFAAEDVASISAASADVLISGGSAVEVFPRERP